MPRLILCLALLLVGSVSAAPRPGAWRPVPGELGVAAVTAITRGGDGALYATAGGWVYRQEGERPWRTVGPYAPTLRWDDGQEAEAVGPFPQAWLDAESAKAQAALEAAVANASQANTLTEDAARLLLQAYVEELDPPADSPYRVVALTAASDGVWIVTGAGVLRASRLGVRGPIGQVQAARAAVTVGDTLWVALERELLAIGPDGQPMGHRVGGVEALAAQDGALVYLADDELWVWPTAGEPERRSPPTGPARAVAAHGTTRWAATSLALYRWQGSDWTLCPPMSTAPVKLVPSPDGLVVLGERRLTYVSADCQAVERQVPPWPGDMALLDVHVEGDNVWLATSTGLSVLVPASVTAADAARVSAFRRALRGLPTLEEVSAQAVRYNQLDAASRAFGWRPIMRGLLPDVTATYVSNPFRVETWDRNADSLLQVDVQQTNPRWVVMANWRLRFDLLAMMFDIERDSTRAELDPGATDPAALAQIDADAAQAEVVEVTADDGVFVDDTFAGTESTAVEVGPAFALLAVERRQAERDRQKLLSEVARLYRDRLRTMYRLWVQLEPEGLHLPEVMRLRESDARLDALTGGRFTRYVRDDR